MKDIDKAKLLLKDDITLVLVKDNDIIKSKLRGIKPLINILNENIDISDYSLADKIVGKAQALLSVKANIKEVYANVMSISATKILNKYNIPYSYKTLTDKIINHSGDDICPMEKAVLNIDDYNIAYEKLKKRII